MDRVRFGRVLGTGARQAAKTLMSAAEAAAAPDPRKATPSASPVAESSRPPAGMTERRNATTASPKPKVDARVVAAQARTLKKSMWAPFARFSSVLWLEVTGAFFAIFALMAGSQVWKWRAAVRLSPATPDARRLYVYFAVFALFAYFAVSSFVRANRRQRR
jgi:hypothetical protein